MDKSGRVLVAYTKGCTGACITDPATVTHSALPVIARQGGGQGLFAASALIPDSRFVPALALAGLAAGALPALLRRRRRARVS